MDSFKDLVSVAPPQTFDDALAFSEIIVSVKDRHADTNIAIAQGLRQFKKQVIPFSASSASSL